MNTNDLRVSYQSYDDIRTQVETFRRDYSSAIQIPVPIDLIIEEELGINIIPIPGLREAWDIDAWVSWERTEISVDLEVFEHNASRYRFSLAHELGHIVLNRAIYQQIKFDSFA